MFDSLTDRLTETFRKFAGRARLDETNIQEGLRDVRLALLEADVNFKVVKDFVERVKQRALGQEVLKSVSPGQQVVKVVHDELVDLLGGTNTALDLRGAVPASIMLVGLQGSGKTTTAAKLALFLRREKKMKPYLVPADVYRPAAIDQLHTLARQLDIPAYPSTPDMNPVDICVDAVEKARELGCTLVLFDTAGRLHIDEPLMDELVAIRRGASPQEILFVADAMTGQDAVTVAQSFNERLDITGVVLTKMDGDARGGAALSIKSVTGKPIKFVGLGEKLSELEIFHPDRAASRILGMGDVLTLMEKAQGSIDAAEAEALTRKMAKAQFDLEDFRTQMRRLKTLGSLDGLLKMIPGVSQLRAKLGEVSMPEKELSRTEAIINSMTMDERRRPAIINVSRRTRIAKGSGVDLAAVNQLLKQFEQMNKMMKKVLGGGQDAGHAQDGQRPGAGHGGWNGPAPGHGPASRHGHGRDGWQPAVGQEGTQHEDPFGPQEKEAFQKTT